MWPIPNDPKTPTALRIPITFARDAALNAMREEGTPSPAVVRAACIARRKRL